MKICLCSIPVEGAGEKLTRSRSEGPLGVSPKIAIVSLIKWMERHGWSADSYKYYDIDMLYPDDEDIRKFFAEYQPTVVGLSAVVSSSYGQIMRISSIIREVCPDAWIVVGGSLADSSAVLLSKTETDICVLGNGEIPWVNFLNYVKEYNREWDYEALGKIKGLSYYNQAKELVHNGSEKAIPADEMPFTDYDLLQTGLQDQPEAINNYFRDASGSGFFDYDERALEPHRLPKVAHVTVSKGCVARCTFCQRSFKGYMVSDTGTLEDHLIDLKERFNVGFVNIADENFGSDKSHAYEVARTLKKHDMMWAATGIRCTSVKYEDIKFYRDHNCSALQFGIESGSQKILDIMDKVFATEHVDIALENCRQLSVFSPLALMLGMPGETDETVMETGAFMGRIAASLGTHPEVMGYSLFYAVPFPATPLYEYGQQIGVIGKSIDEEEQYLHRVSNSSIYKRYYVNLSGAPTKDVVFWDWLAKMEASRIYHQNKKPSTEGSDFAKIAKKIRERELRENPNHALKYSAIKFTAITQFLDKKIIGNPFIDKLPKFIVYPLVKYLAYFEFLIQGILPANKKHNIFNEEKAKEVPQVDDSLMKKLGIAGKRNTLRTIVTQMKQREVC